MPVDQNYDEDEGPSPTGEDAGTDRRFGDFDCPDCSANNPWDDGFGNGDEVRCFYCGQEFLATVNDSGRLKLRAL
jgi:DNA-directed RNA polymerase subunit RPC12/RpoP